jgi:hypothetical protein
MVAMPDMSFSKPLATPASSLGIVTATVAVSGLTIAVSLGDLTTVARYLLQL